MVKHQMISSKERHGFRRSLLRWYSTYGRVLPWRQTREPYAILVSEFMLQQTQVSAVLGFYRKWFQHFPTFAALAAASENEVLKRWEGLGYYARARNLQATAKLVMTQHRGVLPADPQFLRKFPGIGRYTANAVATFAFDQRLPLVEANITRVLTRLFNITVPVASAAGREQLWHTATSLVPKSQPGRFNS